MDRFNLEDEPVPFQPNSTIGINQSKPNSNHSFLKSWKLFFFGGIFVAATTAAWYFWLSADISKERQMTISTKEVIPNVANSNQIAIHEKFESLPSSDSLTSQFFNEAPEQFTKIITRLNETISSLERLNQRLIPANHRNEDFETIKMQLAQVLEKQNEIANILDTRLLDLQTSLHSLIEQFSNERIADSSPPKSAPPFRLISVDLWNNTWYAVLEIDGNITMMEPLAEKDGWRLIEIDPLSQSALFRSALGQDSRLRVEG